MSREPPRDGRLDGELQEAPRNRAVRQVHREPVEAVLVVEVEERGDHRGVPRHRRAVGQEEPAVAVQHAEAPRGGHEQPRAGKQHSHEPDRQVPLGTSKARGDQRDHERRRQDAEDDQDGDPGRQEREEGPRHLRGRVVLASRPQPGVHRDERAGQSPFPEEILEQVRDLECLHEGIRGFGALAEVLREEDGPGEACQAADQNAGADRSCRHAWIRAAECVRPWSRPATRTRP